MNQGNTGIALAIYCTSLQDFFKENIPITFLCWIDMIF